MSDTERENFEVKIGEFRDQVSALKLENQNLRTRLDEHVNDLEAMDGAYQADIEQADRPALVMHGAHDQLVPLASAEEAVKGHPDWELAVFDDLGHIPQMESPERWLRVVDRWLDRPRRAQARAAAI